MSINIIRRGLVLLLSLQLVVQPVLASCSIAVEATHTASTLSGKGGVL
ncbi:hypothetical protein [Thiothrix sp.]|nr:hypothetical protein [Thiothrix sp.]